VPGATVTVPPGGVSGSGASGTGGDAAAGIPVLDAPERPTIAYLGKDFATGLVRYQVSLKVLGWQGSAEAGGLVVRFLSAQPKGPGKVKTPLNISQNDFVVTVEHTVKSAAELEGKPVTVEFRPTGDGFAGFLP
jgi:hypothetical protein